MVASVHSAGLITPSIVGAFPKTALIMYSGLWASTFAIVKVMQMMSRTFRQKSLVFMLVV